MPHGSLLRLRCGRPAVAGLLLLLLPAGASAAPAGCTWFVRAGFTPADGAAADGRQASTAFARIRDAAEAVVNPGDVVCVGPGVYLEGDISSPLDGTATLPIVFRADSTGVSTGDPAGAVVVMPPTGLPPDSTPRAGFLLLGRKYVQIEGFTISGFAEACIQIRSAVSGPGNSTEVVVRNNVLRGCGTGIDVSGEGRFLINGNDVIDNFGSGIGVRACIVASSGSPTPTGSGEATPSSTPAPSPSPSPDARCRGGVSGPVQPAIANNRTIHNVQHGIFIQNASVATVQNNIAFGNFVGVDLRSAKNAVVANNLLYGNADSGITAGSGGEPSPNLVVLNNTIYNNGAWGVQVGDNTTASLNAHVFNNVISDNDVGGIAIARASACGYVAGFNLIDGPTPYGPSTPDNSLYDLVRSDPLFVDPAGPDGVLGWQVVNGTLVDYSADDDFRLRRAAGGQRSSPAIDAGYTTAAALGIEGTTSDTENGDEGAIDLGYHYGATLGQTIANPLPDAFMPVYVRVTGDDGNDGKLPAQALASLQRASKFAKAGVTVIVGPGQYADANVGPAVYSGRVTYRADSAGAETGDVAGPVLIDPSLLRPGANKDTAFLLMQSCQAVVEGFYVRFAADAAIQVRQGSDGTVVRNNVVVTNSRGIDVVDADDVQVVNNLVYDNDTGGIQVGGTDTARRAQIRNNTCYGNVGGNALSIGVGTGSAPGARVEYNLFVGNGGNGVNSRFAYSGQYNLLYANTAGDYGDAASRQPGDRIDTDPLFVNPAGPDGRLGGADFADDQFELSQQSAGQDVTSAAVDGGAITAEKAGMGTGTTSTDGAPDSGLVDLGFHYVARPPSTLYVDVSGDDANDGRLEHLPLRTIAEALRRAAPGTLVRIGAGLFEESGLRPGAGVSLVGADAARTTISANGASTVFDVHADDVSLTHLGVTGAKDAGVRGRGNRLRVIDTRVYGNDGRGIILPEGTGAFLFNNLVYGNGSTGMVLGSATTGADQGTVANNTVYGNGGLGISVGLDASVPSRAASVVNNVVTGNVKAGLGVGGDSAATLHAGYNCNDDGYKGMSRPSTDIVGDPRLVAPESLDFHLAQLAAGQGVASRCVDTGWRNAEQIMLHDATTRSDGVFDVGVADIGYHYGLPTVDGSVMPLLRLGAPAGDCDGDGVTRINELVGIVSIALGIEPLSSCVVSDANGDGAVTIDELLAAVTDSLGH